MPSISPVNAGSSTYSNQPVRPVARIRSQTQSTQSSLKLKVRTAEGDTVELSLDANHVQQVDRGYARTAHSAAKTNQSTQSDSLDFNVSIKGNLNDQELSDIKSLIQSLTTGQDSGSPLSSLSAYQGAFSQTTGSQKSTLTLYG